MKNATVFDSPGAKVRLDKISTRPPGKLQKAEAQSRFQELNDELFALEKDPIDAWKLSVQDWKDREKWDEFSEAYEDAISRCAAPHAPWMVVPSDAKWYRNLVVAEALVDALRPYRKEWHDTLAEQ